MLLMCLLMVLFSELKPWKAQKAIFQHSCNVSLMVLFSELETWKAQKAIFQYFLIWHSPLIQTSAQPHVDGNEYTRSAIQRYKSTLPMAEFYIIEDLHFSLLNFWFKLAHPHVDGNEYTRSAIQKLESTLPLAKFYIIESVHFSLLKFLFKLAQMHVDVNENKECRKVGIKKEYHKF